MASGSFIMSTPLHVWKKRGTVSLGEGKDKTEMFAGSNRG